MVWNTYMPLLKRETDAAAASISMKYATLFLVLDEAISHQSSVANIIENPVDNIQKRRVLIGQIIVFGTKPIC
ncbi:hypothetical protein DMX09_21955 [Pseudomonas protegens]|nr:hypothetical protein DMX09_21955 [Pseudomonas protegens]